MKSCTSKTALTEGAKRRYTVGTHFSLCGCGGVGGINAHPASWGVSGSEWGKNVKVFTYNLCLMFSYYRIICITWSMKKRQRIPLNCLCLNIIFMIALCASAGCNCLVYYGIICISWLHWRTLLYKMFANILTLTPSKMYNFMGGQEKCPTMLANCKESTTKQFVKKTKKGLL